MTHNGLCGSHEVEAKEKGKYKCKCKRKCSGAGRLPGATESRPLGLCAESAEVDQVRCSGMIPALSSLTCGFSIEITNLIILTNPITDSQSK